MTTNTKNFLLCDTETSGLNLPMATILEAGFRLLDPDFNRIDQLMLPIMPTEYQWANASKEALAVNGITLEYLKERDAKPMVDSVRILLEWVMKHNINYDTTWYVGQNAAFDIRMLKHYMPELHWAKFPLENPVNVIDMAKDYQRKNPDIAWPIHPVTGKPSFSGKNISIALGLSAEADLHTAEGGVDALERNFIELVRRRKAAK